MVMREVMTLTPAALMQTMARAHSHPYRDK